MTKLKQILKAKHMSVKECSNISGIPYSTLLDIVNGKTFLSNSATSVTYRLSKVLNYPMEELVSIDIFYREESWDNFRSNVQHELKSMGDRNFLMRMVSDDIPNKYWEADRIKEALYLVAMFDYLCRINNMPRYNGFARLRDYKLNELCVSQDYIISDMLGINNREDEIKNAIPEFLKYNILEGNIRDVE